MLRLQAPLPDRYTLATDDELDARIAAAKAALGDRLLILGHHYQRDEVIQLGRCPVGDSFKLARFAADNDQATDIVFCGVHFMAESADVLTGDHQRVILPDLNAGCSMADMADIDQVEEAGRRSPTSPTIDRVVPDHLHELLGRAEGVRRRARRRGVHVVERPGGARVGARPGRQGAVLPRPAPRPQHRLRHGLRRSRHARLEPAPRARRARGARRQGGDVPAVEGPLLGAPALPPRARRRVPGRAPRRSR